MKPELSGEDTGDELGLALQVDDDNDVLEASSHPSLSENKESVAKFDTNFFNRFDDDFDESDMKPSA